MKENEKCVCAISMRLYKYMGRYGPKESKNRQKVKIFLLMLPILLALFCRNCVLERCESQEGKREGSLEAALSRTRSARIPTAMLFFCCHKCHTRTKIVEKKAEKFTGESDEKRVFPCCVLCVSRN